MILCEQPSEHANRSECDLSLRTNPEGRNSSTNGVDQRAETCLHDGSTLAVDQNQFLLLREIARRRRHMTIGAKT